MVMKRVFAQKFVGRENVLSELKFYLDQSIQGKGRFVLISGEAGIGKTRLVSELKTDAISKNVKCLEGNCLYHDISDPYLPFITALSQTREPSIIEDKYKYTMINEAFLINEGGKVISYASRLGANIMDEDIVGGMLAAVETFVKDAFGDGESTKSKLDTLVYGPIRIYIEHGEHIFLAVVFSGAEPEGIRGDLKQMVSTIEKKYHGILDDWDGNVSKVRGINDIIQKLTLVRYRVKRGLRDIDLKNEKDRVFERVLQMIIEASLEDPIFLVLEDIHWANISTLQLLQYVARNTKDSRILICATYRPEELDNVEENKVHPLREMLQRMSRHKMFQSIELKSLNEKEVSQMLTSMLKTSEYPNDFMTRIYKETEGNPFYVEEMVFAFRDEGIINMNGGAWQLNKISSSIIPPTIKDLISLRIERLDKISIDTIKYASVLGKEFDFNVLGQTMSLNDEDLIHTLENLEMKNLISVSHENDELYKFNHSKIREVVYDGLGRQRKRMIHEKAATSIMRLNKENINDVVYQLAHHYSKTKDYENALKYSISAGDKASREFAIEEAYEYLQLALDALDNIDDESLKTEKKIEILTKLGDICFVMGEWDLALKYLNELIELSLRTGDKDVIFGGYRTIGNIHLSRSEWDQAKENLERGMRIGRENKDHRGMADCLYFLGALYEKRGSFHEAIDFYGDSMKEALTAGDNHMIANAYLGMGRVYAQQGQYQDSKVHMQKSIEILEGLGDLNELAKAYINLGRANYCQDEFDDSISHYEKALAWARKTKNIRLEGHGLSNLGELYIKKNEPDKAKDCLNRALGIFEKLDEKFMISDVYRHFGSVHKLEGQWDKSTEYFEKSIEISKELNMPYYVGCGYSEFGMMFMAKGDSENAQKLLRQAYQIFKELDNQEYVKKIEKVLET